VTGALQKSMRLVENYGPFANREGCDFEAGLEHLQPWSSEPALRHAHALHIRYYYSDLERSGLSRVEMDIGGKKRPFYRFAAGVHYEVEHADPHHSNIESCPICGRTGAYQDLKGDLNGMAHDPLGLEMVMRGTIRGDTVRFEEPERREVRGIEGLRERFEIVPYLFSPWREDLNTYRLGILILLPR
jgi:hypothetical protein